MMRFLPFCLLLLLFPLCAAAQYDFVKAEASARRLIYQKPDSAAVIIRKTLAQKGKLHDTVAGNSYNLYGMYFGIKGIPDSSVFYIRKSLGYLEAYPKLRVRALSNLGIALRNKGRYDESVTYLKEALALHRKDDNKVGIAMVYGELASDYTLMGDYKTSVDYLLESVRLLKAENNTRHLVAVKQKLANTYLKMGNIDFAADMYKDCLAEFKARGIDKNYYLTLLNLAETYIQRRKFTEAKAALSEAAGGLKRYGDRELTGITLSKVGNIDRQQARFESAVRQYQAATDLLIEARSPFFIRIASEYIDLLNKIGNYKEASAFATRAAAAGLQSKNPEDKLLFDKAVAVAYAHTGKQPEAAAHYQEAISLMDTLLENRKVKDVLEAQAKYETNRHREKNEELSENNKALKEQARTERIIALLVVTVCAGALFIIFIMLKNSRYKVKLQQQALKSAEAERHLAEEKRKHEAVLREAGNEMLLERQRELAAMTLRMAKDQQSLTALMGKFEAGQIKSLQEVQTELRHIVVEKDYWRQFEKRFNSLHPDFSRRLSEKYPKLTRSDIEFCSLLKMNLSNKEIAAMLQISHESAITKKYRIKKKMDVSDDSVFEQIIGLA